MHNALLFPFRGSALDGCHRSSEGLSIDCLSMIIHRQPLRNTARHLLLAAALFAVLIHGRAESDAWAAEEKEGQQQQCFEVVYPPPRRGPHELGESEYSSVTIDMQVNCPGIPQAQEMRVVSESMSEQIVDMSDWGSDMFELEMDLSATKLRGVQSWALSLRRDGSDGPTEFTEFSLSMSSLFNPHFNISFPPEGDAYTFYKEVVPFFQSSVHEPREETERRGLLRNFTIRLEVTDVSGQGANDMVLNYQQASIAYFGGRHIMPDGTYNLSFTLTDALGKEYPPVVHRRIVVDASTGVPSKQSGDSPTSCPSLEPGAHPTCTSPADCNGFPCIDLGCVCSEDWFGVDCRGDIHDTSAYIPQADPGVDPVTCAQAHAFRSGARELEDDIWAVNHPPTGDDSCSRLSAFLPDKISWFGTILRSLAMALGRSMQTRSPLTFSENWIVITHEGCPRGAFECYFQPTSSCSRRDDTPRYAWVTDAIEINPPIYSNASPLAWGEEDRCQDSETCVDFDEIPSPAVLLDAGSELEGRQNSKLVRSLGTISGVSARPKHGGSPGFRWFSHPDGGHRVMDLTGTFLEVQAGPGRSIRISDEYTASTWLIWHPSDLQKRCAHTSTSGESAFCVGPGGRHLGTISRGGVFQPCGYEISVVGWQLVVAVASKGKTRMFINGVLACEAGTAMTAGGTLASIGLHSASLGHVSQVAMWELALSEAQVKSMWESSRLRYGLPPGGGLTMRPKDGGGHIAARGYVVSMDSTPREYRKNGTLWFMAHALQYVMRPSRNLEWMLRDAVRATNFRGPVIGMHVRRGDACPVRVCPPLEHFLDAARKMRSKYGTNRIYLATDHPDVPGDLREMDGTFDWTSLNNFALSRKDLSDMDSQILGLKVLLGQTDRNAVATASLVDLLLLSRCDYLVGQFSSHFLKAAFQLSVAEKGFVPPYVGIDGPPGW